MLTELPETTDAASLLATGPWSLTANVPASRDGARGMLTRVNGSSPTVAN